jgi:hypothetical protein
MRSDPICRECGSPFSAQRSTREFCSSNCRAQFHNRQARHGRDFFSAVMAIRYDRDAAKEARMWSLLCRMAAAVKAEDNRNRNGRPSWDSVAKLRARATPLRATLVGVNVAGSRRKQS